MEKKKKGKSRFSDHYMIFIAKGIEKKKKNKCPEAGGGGIVIQGFVYRSNDNA